MSGIGFIAVLVIIIIVAFAILWANKDEVVDYSVGNPVQPTANSAQQDNTINSVIPNTELNKLDPSHMILLACVQ